MDMCSALNRMRPLSFSVYPPPSLIMLIRASGHMGSRELIGTLHVY